MDAALFFTEIVKPNYKEFLDNQSELRRLWNAVVSMNTVAEYVALDRLGYEPVVREELDREAKKIREANQALLDLKVCAETLNHVRKLDGNASREITSIASSTGLLPDQPATWVIEHGLQRYILSDVLRRAFDALSRFPEF